MREKQADSMIQTMIRKILSSMIVGDALGSAVDGMTKGHIRAHFRNIAGYIDPGPALKSRPELWRKPGLYSSMTQMMLIMAMACPRRGLCADAFGRAVAASPEVAGYDYGIFRYPGAVERSFIQRMKNPLKHPGIPDQPCGRIIPIVSCLGLRGNSLPDQILDVAAVIRAFTQDYPTLAAAMVYSALIRSMSAESGAAAVPIRSSIAAAREIASAIESDSAAVFAAGVNPGSLLRELRQITDLLEETAQCDTLESAGEIIIDRVNSRLKTPVTRATVNHPVALLPYSLAISSLAPEPLITAAFEGGAAAALAAMTGAVSPGRIEADLEKELVSELVNRKKILALIDGLAEGPVPSSVLDDFIRSEASLTAKEQEELAARLKHGRKKQRKTPLTQADKERELTRHAVESWTKLDKARWKKERRRHDKNDES